MEAMLAVLEAKALAQPEGAVDEELEGQITLHEELQKRTADQKWLLLVLKVLDPNHRFFQRNYNYYRPRR